MIDSSQSQSKMIISVLGSVSELERENIIVQSMNGRREKAKQGGWNGGFAPFGYTLENGDLKIIPEEAVIVRQIFTEFVHGGKGYTIIAKQLIYRVFLREKQKTITKKT